MVKKELDEQRLYARLDDLCDAADRGEPGISPFLTETEAARARSYLKRRGAKFFLFGGYEGAERKRLYVLPEYVEGEGESALESYGYSTNIKALLVRGSGYARLTHRDFLGSALGLGIDRAVLGDIVVLDGEQSAVVFCDDRISGFICLELARVGTDKVAATEVDPSSISLPDKSFIDINLPISSTRLDCVIAALCNLSRERASAVIENGSVALDFEIEDRPDRKLMPPCVVSVKGFGKYRLLDADTLTKKGKRRLKAQKYS